MYSEFFRYLSDDTLNKILAALQHDIKENRNNRESLPFGSYWTMVELNKDHSWIEATIESIQWILFKRYWDKELQDPAILQAIDRLDNSWFALMSLDEITRSYNRGELSQDEYELYKDIWAINPRKLSTKEYQIIAAIKRLKERYS